MKDIAEGVARWRERGERIAVATVVATRRSTPRPIGAKFAVSEADPTKIYEFVRDEVLPRFVRFFAGRLR